MPPWRVPLSVDCCLQPQPRSWSCRTCLRCCGRVTMARRLTAYSTRLRMNYFEPLDRPLAPVTTRDTQKDPPKHRADKQRRWGGRLLGVGVVIGLFGALAFGAWSHYAQYS